MYVYNYKKKSILKKYILLKKVIVAKKLSSLHVSLIYQKNLILIEVRHVNF